MKPHDHRNYTELSTHFVKYKSVFYWFCFWFLFVYFCCRRCFPIAQFLDLDYI